jgi:hypothetical protein
LFWLDFKITVFIGFHFVFCKLKHLLGSKTFETFLRGTIFSFFVM